MYRVRKLLPEVWCSFIQWGRAILYSSLSSCCINYVTASASNRWVFGTSHRQQRSGSEVCKLTGSDAVCSNGNDRSARLHGNRPDTRFNFVCLLQCQCSGHKKNFAAWVALCVSAQNVKWFLQQATAVYKSSLWSANLHGTTAQLSVIVFKVPLWFSFVFT